MYVFTYDRETGAYLGGTPCNFDQREPGRVLCPAYASKTPIPRFDETKEWPFYVPDPKDLEGGKWELRPISHTLDQAGT